MSTSSSRRVATFLLCSLFHIQGVLARGGGKGGGGGGGKGIGRAGDASSSLGLPPALDAVFALTVVIALFTLYQLGKALGRFKSLKLPEGEPTVPYDVGTLFRILLTSYTTIYLISNILYAVYIASFGGLFLLPDSFETGTVFAGQSAIVLFYATFLCIIAYRQRIQLNPAERVFNLKAFLDGWLLATILILAVAVAAVSGNSKAIRVRIATTNLSIAYEVFGFLASLNVAVSSLMARARLSKANIQDKIINISAFAVGPIVVAGGIFRIVNVGIQLNARPFFNPLALLIATVVIEGTVSIAAVYCCLLMGAPPKPPKADSKGALVEKKV